MKIFIKFMYKVYVCLAKSLIRLSNIGLPRYLRFYAFEFLFPFWRLSNKHQFPLNSRSANSKNCLLLYLTLDNFTKNITKESSLIFYKKPIN